MKDIIKEFLSNYYDYYIDGNGKAHDIIRATPDELAEELVKLFAIPDVVGRSEQFTCKTCGTHEKEWSVKNSDWYCKTCKHICR